MSNNKLKPKKDSLVEIVDKYSNDYIACVNYFFKIKWSTGFYCEKCGCTHYSFIKSRKKQYVVKWGKSLIKMAKYNSGQCTKQYHQDISWSKKKNHCRYFYMSKNENLIIDIQENI